MDVPELVLHEDGDDDDLPATQLVDNRVLKGVTAYVEVRSSSDNRSEAVARQLIQLGAAVEKKFTDDVTHVVFKEGSVRTSKKAQKKGIHLVSVLWVENCKLNQEHVSERMYPAVVPETKGPAMLVPKLKKHKSMQPKDFEEEWANSAERLRKKKKRINALTNLCTAEQLTPSNSPYLGAVLVHDTQQHSQTCDGGFIFTPVRLTIPETPPSMREKMAQLRKAKAELAGSYTNSDSEGEDIYQKEINFKQLQKKLFDGSLQEGESSFTHNSPTDISSILTADDDDNDTGINDNEDPLSDDNHNDLNKTKDDSELFNLSIGSSQSSVNNDILSIAKNINATLNSPSQKIGRLPFGIDSDENLLSSQEIKTVANVTVKYSSINGEVAKSAVERLPGISEVDTHEEHVGEKVSDQTIVGAKSPKNDVKAKPKPRASRKSSRRLSVQQALEALNQTGLPDVIEERDDNLKTLDKDPVSTSCTKNNGNVSEEILDYDQGKRKSDPVIENSPNPKKSRSRSSKDGSEKETRKKSNQNEDNSECVKRRGRSSKDNEINTDKPSKRKSKSSQKDENSEKSSNDIETCDDKLSKRKSNQNEEVCRNGRKGRSRSSKESNRKSSETINDSIDQTGYHASETNNTKHDDQSDVQEQNVAKTEENKKGAKGVKGKKTMKKLLSLTDVYDRNSVLLEPTTSSNVDRPKLFDSVEKPTRKGRKRKSDKTNISSKNDNVDLSSNVDKDNSIHEVNEKEKIKRGRKSKTVDTSDCVGEETGKRKPGRPRRKTNSGKSNTLVNDTVVEQTSPVTRSAGVDISEAPMTRIKDVSTELNLTKDNSLVCSIRETTLSMSMSAAYNDTNMPSFLSSQRRSIDEFSASQQKRRKKRKLTEKSVLTSICESVCSDSNRTTDSDSSCMDADAIKKQMKRTRSGKLFRPSIVMTNLHFCEQDVVISVVKKLGGFIIAENVNETTTHVICGEARRTLNVIQCIARGIWLISKDWAIASLEKGRWLPEEDYEYTSAFPMCKVTRIEREQCTVCFRQTLFSNIGPIYVSGKSQPPRIQLVALIKLCGGQVINTKDRASIYIGNDFHPGMTCVKPTWLLDCIMSHVQKPMDPYFLDRPKREASPEY